MDTRGYIPGLHALRGYAALSVVVWHTTGIAADWFGVPDTTPLLRALTLTGTDAVTLFYVLSGFLLTSQLLVRRHHIDPLAFYRRRIRRIAPLYYLVLLVTALISMALAPVRPDIFRPEYDVVQFPAALLFVAYIPLSLGFISGMVSHFWSLGVEMAFYALAPWLASARRVPVALAAVAALRLLVLAVTPADSPLNHIVLYLKVDALAIGGLFAWLWVDRRMLALALSAWRWRAVLIILAVILILFETPRHNIAFDYAVAVLSGLLIVNVAAGRFVVENRVTRWLGDASYGIYLWHMLALFTTGAVGLRGVTLYAATIGLSLVLAGFSYHYVERPFLRLRPSLMPQST